LPLHFNPNKDRPARRPGEGYVMATTNNIATVSTLALEIHRFIAEIRDPRSGHTQASLFTHNEFARGMINALYIVNGGGEHNCPEVAECYSKLNDAMAFAIASHPNYC